MDGEIAADSCAMCVPGESWPFQTDSDAALLFQLFQTGSNSALFQVFKQIRMLCSCSSSSRQDRGLRRCSSSFTGIWTLSCRS